MHDGLASGRAIGFGWAGRAASKDARLCQMHEAVDEHFAASVETAIEWCDLRAWRDLDAERRQQRSEICIACMPKNQNMCERVGERSYADLQGPAVFDQGGSAQRHGIVGERHGLLGRCEQVVVPPRRL